MKWMVINYTLGHFGRLVNFNMFNDGQTSEQTLLRDGRPYCRPGYVCIELQTIDCSHTKAQ